MHVAVVANCQARPVASLVKIFAPTVTELSTIIVHLSQKDSAPNDYELLDKADVIFAQFVTDQYAAAHLATSRLRDRYGSKVVTWPNIFFRGQQPDLAYASVKKKDGMHIPRLLGPLREYHFKSIYTAWKSGMRPSECLDDLNSESEKYIGYTLEIADLSIRELQKREVDLDVPISDIIARDWRDRRLFFTFNHPASYLLHLMASRLVDKAGLAELSITDIGKNEPLSLVIPPIFGRDATLLGNALGSSATSQGAEITFDGATPKLGVNYNYNLDDLIEVTFKVYESSMNREDEVRFSPP